VRLHQLGSRYAEQLELVREGRAAAQRVSDQCQETVHLGILEGRDVVYIAKVDSTHAVRMVSAAGLRLPAHCTAVGKMLLASLPESALNELLSPEHPLQAMTPTTITDPAALRADLDETRSRGASFEQCESNLDVACVAAPVRDHTGNVVAAMSISVPLIRWTPQRRDELRKLVTAGAEDLSEHLGYRG
jgi:IclR family transcriptional regulator, KDG regulon repressor